MGEAIKRSFFAMGIAALAVMIVTGFTFSAGVTHGQETDVDVGVEDSSPTSGGASTTTSDSTPPQAPIDQGPSADAGGTANTLPSAGSGGYLNSGESWPLTVALAGLVLLGLGSALGVRSLRSIRK